MSQQSLILKLLAIIAPMSIRLFSRLTFVAANLHLQQILTAVGCSIGNDLPYTVSVLGTSYPANGPTDNGLSISLTRMIFGEYLSIVRCQ